MHGLANQLDPPGGLEPQDLVLHSLIVDPDGRERAPVDWLVVLLGLGGPGPGGLQFVLVQLLLVLGLLQEVLGQVAAAVGSPEINLIG